jgi:hypothetical protein
MDNIFEAEHPNSNGSNHDLAKAQAELLIHRTFKNHHLCPNGMELSVILGTDPVYNRQAVINWISHNYGELSEKRSSQEIAAYIYSEFTKLVSAFS